MYQVIVYLSYLTKIPEYYYLRNSKIVINLCKNLPGKSYLTRLPGKSQVTLSGKKLKTPGKSPQVQVNIIIKKLPDKSYLRKLPGKIPGKVPR